MNENRASGSNLSDMNAGTFDEGVVCPNDSETFEQIIRYYLKEVQHILDEIKTLSNQTDRPALTNATTSEKTVIAPDVSALLDNKISIINRLTALVKDSRLKDFSHFQKEAFWSIPIMMEEECDGMQKVVESLRKQKEINQQTMTKLEEFEQFHNEVNSTDVSPNLSLALLEKINFEVSRDFKKCKNDFIEVMETAFPDSDFQEVMLMIMEKSTNSSGEWFELDEIYRPHGVTNFLLDTGLLINNPNDFHQFKLIT